MGHKFGNAPMHVKRHREIEVATKATRESDITPMRVKNIRKHDSGDATETTR